MKKTLVICAGVMALGMAAASAKAQEKPAADEMQHMHHGGSRQGGFMQGGMHHALAKGVKLEGGVNFCV